MIDSKINHQMIKEYIPFLQGNIQIEPILKGYSGDNKYMIVRDEQKYLLRTFDIKQYRIGLEAGRELFKINQYAAPEHMTSWYDVKFAKHQKCMKEYAELGIRVNEDIGIIAFIDEHIKLMRGRPNQFSA